MEKVDLEEVFYNNIDLDSDYSKKELKNDIIVAMKEACKEALKLAADKAQLSDFASEFLQEGAEDAIDKQSILDVIDLIE